MNNCFPGPKMLTPAINEQMLFSLTFWKRLVLYRLTNEGFTVEKRTHCFMVYTLASVDRQSSRTSPGETNMVLLISLLCYTLILSTLRRDPLLHYRFLTMPTRVLRNSKHSTCLWTNLVTLRSN